MDYVSLLMEAVARRQPFRLHPAADPADYQMTDNMRDAPTKWRARAHEGFAHTDPKKSYDAGTMDHVGYVMISLTDDTIIPISRADEHHTGYDHLYDLSTKARKKKIDLNVNDFIPIFTHGNNYIYDKKEVPKLLNVAAKYLSYGGRDGPLKGTSDMRGMLMNLSEFVAAGGKAEIKPGELAPAGKRVLAQFTLMANAIRTAAQSGQESQVGKAFQTAKKVCAELRPYLSNFDIKDYEILYRPQVLKDLRTGGLEALEKAFFGFHGLKNQIHNSLRRYVDRQAKGERDVWADDGIRDMWGDVDLAVDMLGRI